MGVDLFTALLSGGHGLTSGILANRQKKEQDAKERQALIYKQAQDAIAAAGDADMRRLKEKEIDNYKAPMAQAKLDTAADYHLDVAGRPEAARVKREFTRTENEANRQNQRIIAAGHDAVTAARNAIYSGNLVPQNARQAANSMAYQLAGARAERVAASKELNNVMADDTAKAAAQERIDAADAIISDLEETLNNLNAIATRGAASPTGPAMNTGAPIPGIMGSGAPVDTTDVQGATGDAIETPAGTVKPDTAAVTKANPATGPTAAETRGPLSFLMPTLSDALDTRGGKKVPTAPTHKPGKVPPEIMAKIEAVVSASGIKPGTNQWNEQVARRMILWQRQQAAKGL